MTGHAGSVRDVDPRGSSGGQAAQEFDGPFDSVTPGIAGGLDGEMDRYRGIRGDLRGRDGQIRGPQNSDRIVMGFSPRRRICVREIAYFAKESCRRVLDGILVPIASLVVAGARGSRSRLGANPVGFLQLLGA